MSRDAPLPAELTERARKLRNDVPAPKVPDAVMDGIAASYEKMMKKMQAAAQGQAQAAVAQR